MIDIEQIRKKHEKWKRFDLDRGYGVAFQSSLSHAQVDALFAALDEARGKVPRALMKNYYLEHIDEIEQGLKGGNKMSDEKIIAAAKNLSEAVWNWHKNVSIWYDGRNPYLSVPVDVANKIFQARLDFDSLLAKEADK